MGLLKAASIAGVAVIVAASWYAGAWGIADGGVARAQPPAAAPASDCGEGRTSCAPAEQLAQADDTSMPAGALRTPPVRGDAAGDDDGKDDPGAEGPAAGPVSAVSLGDDGSAADGSDAGASHGGDPGAKDAPADGSRADEVGSVASEASARDGGAARPIQPAASAADEAVERATAESEPAPGLGAESNEDGPDGADEPGEADRDVAALCALMKGAARRHGVPQDFFIRLIHKESRFNPNAVSPVGAQGIAQFMPATARIRGLADPFDREEALYASAAFLADLEARFGSWGLAAAGYNGGPNRVEPFVAGEAGLPYETIDYVYAITGRTAQYWAARAKRERSGAGLDPLGDSPSAPSSGETPRSQAGAEERAAASTSPQGAPSSTTNEGTSAPSDAREAAADARREGELNGPPDTANNVAPTSHAASSPRPPHDGTQPPATSAGASAPSDASKAAADASGDTAASTPPDAEDRTAAAAEAAASPGPPHDAARPLAMIERASAPSDAVGAAADASRDVEPSLQPVVADDATATPPAAVSSDPAVSRASAPTPSPRPRYTALEVDCPQLVARLGRSRAVSPPGTGGWTRWGAQVAGHPKRAVAMRQYARIKSRLPGDLVARGPSVVVRRFAARGRRPIHAVQFAAANQSEAKALCKRIAKSLAPCVVVKNG